MERKNEHEGWGWRVGVEIERTRGMGVERGWRERMNTRDRGGERVERKNEYEG